MKLLTYEVGKKEYTGILSQDGAWVYPISAAGMEYRSMTEVIREIGASEKEMLEYISGQPPYKVPGAVPFEEVRVLAPIPNPEQDILCLGINYLDHAEEAARFQKESFEKPASAIYFSKRVNCAVNPNEGIPAHKNLTGQLDYEAELAVVIGKDASDVTMDQVKDYIFGYTILNDVSAREVQTEHKQWYFGKSLDGFAPMGPCILTVDSVPFPPKLKIQSRVNGELRQDSDTGLLIHGIGEIICELSKGMTLKAGTIIATGTPAGVGMGFDPPKFLKPGDRVECIIEEIGVLENTVID